MSSKKDLNRKTGEKLDTSLSLLHGALESVTDGLVVVDLAGQVVAYNQKFGQMWDMPAAMMKTGNLDEWLVFLSDQLKNPAGFLQKVRALDSQSQAEEHDIIELKDDRIFERCVKPQRPGNKVIGWVWNFRDITERKQLGAQIQESLEHRSRQVRLSTQIAQEISAASDLRQLYQRVVTLVKSQFGYYHVQLLRYDSTVNSMILVANSGETDARMLVVGHRLPVGTGLIGTVTALGASVLRPDVAQVPDWRSSLLLPQAKGELAVPIKLGGQVLGILDVQSDEPDRLDADDQLVLEGLCGQIAIAIENIRLREEMEDRLQELNALQRLTSQEGWQSFQATREKAAHGYLFDQTAVRPASLADLELSGEVFGGQELETRNLKPETLQSNGRVVTKPMTVHGQVIGALGVQNDPNQPLPPDDQAFLDTVAEQVAEALERARLLEQTQKRAVELEAVAQVSTVAATTLEVQELLQSVVDLTKTSFGLYHAHVYLLNESGDVLVLAAGASEIGRQMVAKGWSIPLEQERSLVARAARTRQGVIVNDVRQEPNFLPNSLLPHTRAEMAIPLVARDSMLGVLDVQADTINHFTAEDVRIQTTLAGQVAVALQNAQLFAEQHRTSLLLSRRVKELNCLNEIGRAIVEAPTIPELLQWVTERIPPATQYPDICVAAIEYDGQVYGMLEAIKLSNQIVHALRIGGEVAGRVYISYTEKHDFLNEESALVGGIASRVGGYIENRQLFAQMQAALAETEILYSMSTLLNTATTLQDVLLAVISPVIARDASFAGLYTIDLDETGQPEWVETVAVWTRQGNSPVPIGARFYLPELPLAKLWISDPDHAILISDIRDDERVDLVTRDLFLQSGTLASVILPLALRERWVGIISLSWPAPCAFTGDQQRLYQSLAKQAAVIVDSRLLFEQVQRRATQLTKLAQIEAALSRAVTEEEILAVVALSVEADQAVRLTLSYIETDEAGQPITWRNVARWHGGAIQREDPSLSMILPLDRVPGSGLWLNAPDTVLFVENMQTHPHMDKASLTLVTQFGIKGLAIIPLRSGGRWQGAITFDWSDPHGFSEDEQFVFRQLLEPVAAVVASRRAYLAQQEALAEIKNLYDMSNYISTANSLEEILTAVAQGITTPAINRILLVMFEQDATGEVEAMTVAANWYNSAGTPPTPIGTRYPREVFSTVSILLSPDLLFFDDVQDDPQLDPATLAVLQRLNIRAMAVLPLWVGARQLGALLLEAEEAYHFSKRDKQTYLSVARQAAVAIDNQRLLAETRAALAEVKAIQRRYTLQSWETYRAKEITLSYEQVREGVKPLNGELPPEVSRAIDQEQLLTADPGPGREGRRTQLIISDPSSMAADQQNETGSSLIVPLTIRDEIIGILGLQEMDQTRHWSPEEIALIEAISEQLGQVAESLRLVDETQQRAAREKRVNEIGEKIQQAQSLEEAVRIAVKEVGLSLQAPQTIVELAVK